MKLLLIEDNEQLSHWLASLLREQAFVVDQVPDGDAADRQLRDARYDLVLLDLNIARLSGKGVLRRLRERRDDVPVLILTATASLDQKVQCLEIGADDYMVKPIEGRELVARIKALVRRQVPGRANTLLCGDLGYDLQTRQFSLAGALLETLMLKQGSAVPKQTLLDGLFDLDDEAGVDALELYVHRLRKKLDASQATIRSEEHTSELQSPLN